jgi:hypothetical protein
MAPNASCSTKVLDDKGTDLGRESPKGRSSNIIAAIEYTGINGYGRRLFVHGVNMSIGYEFEPSGSHAAKARSVSRLTGSCAAVSWWWLPPAIPVMA